VIGNHIPLQSHHTEPGKAASSNNTDKGNSNRAEMPKRPEQLKQDRPDSSHEIDISDPFLQMNTISYFNKLLKFHKINLLAELSNENGQTYIALSDGATGNLIKRLKLEDVISGMKSGDSSMINLSI
jgi:uncharacterized FlaG/YvyC family protein